MMAEHESQGFYIKRSQAKPKWQVHVLREQLQLLQLSKVRSLSPIERDYASFYHIDFGAYRSSVRHQLGYLRIGDLKIAVNSFEQQAVVNRGTILLVHGLFDHIGLYGSAIEFFLSHGYNVVGFDLPGHGLSSGKAVEVANFSEYQAVFERMVQFCLDVLPAPLSVFGQSTGGAIIIDYLTAEANQKKRAKFMHTILFAPLVRPVNWRQAAALHTVLHPFVRRWKRKFLGNSSDMEFQQFLRHYDPLQATHLSVPWVGALKRWIRDIEARESVAESPIVLQGHKDVTVDWGHNMTMISRLFVTPKIVFVPHASHHLVNESSDILHEIYRRLANCLDLPKAACKS